MCRLLAILVAAPCFLFASAEAEARGPLGPVLFNRARTVGPASGGMHYRQAIRPFAATQQAPRVNLRRYGHNRVYTPAPQHGSFYRSGRPAVGSAVITSSPRAGTTYRLVPAR